MIFNSQISLKLLSSKGKTLFARLQLFGFYSSRMCAHLVYTWQSHTCAQRPLKRAIQLYYRGLIYVCCITLYSIYIACWQLHEQVQTVCSWVMIFTTQLQAAPAVSYTPSCWYAVANSTHPPLNHLLHVRWPPDIEYSQQGYMGLHFSAFIN